MTLTLELSPETEARLVAAAQASGQTLTAFAAARLDEIAAEEAEDAADLAEAEAIMAKSDPAKRRTLDELRVVLGRHPRAV